MSAPLNGQALVAPDRLPGVTDVFDSSTEHDPLGCTVDPVRPFLDFRFRFEAGYIVRCPVRIFGGKEQKVAALIRVTPEGRPPATLSSLYRVPGLPASIQDKTDLRRVKAEIETSGGFAIGEGRYGIELALLNDGGRLYRRNWKIEAFRKRAEQHTTVALPPETVSPFSKPSWKGPQAQFGRGLRLTVLLDAAPIDPYALKLRAWDTAFLLDSVSSLLNNLPCQSVRLIGFNLDQGKEVFREEHFNSIGLERLSDSLQSLELGTISYRALQNRNSWADLLTGVSNQEVNSPNPVDAVIFVGPANRIAARIPKEAFDAAKGNKPRFFYLEYFPSWTRGAEFPDAIDHVVAEENGATFKIHAPGELAQAFQKLLGQLRPEGYEANCCGSSSNK